MFKKQRRFKMNKKGAELSMNVIIIAAIGLLILVILAILVISRATNVSTGTDCIAKGGICKISSECTQDKVISDGTCSDNTKTCCSPI